MAVAVSPLLVMIAWIVGLTVAVILIGRGRDARDLTWLALIFAVAAGLSFTFWPLWLYFSVSGRIDVDPTTGSHTLTESEHWQVELFPFLHRFGLQALLFAAIPVLITGFANVWQSFGLPRM